MFKQTNEGFQDKQLTSVATVIICYLRALKLQETVGVGGMGGGGRGVWGGGDYNQGESPETFPQESPNQRTPHIESRMNLVSRHV